jgi:hypothetical protein
MTLSVRDENVSGIQESLGDYSARALLNEQRVKLALREYFEIWATDFDHTQDLLNLSFGMANKCGEDALARSLSALNESLTRVRVCVQDLKVV